MNATCLVLAHSSFVPKFLLGEPVKKMPFVHITKFLNPYSSQEFLPEGNRESRYFPAPGSDGLWSFTKFLYSSFWMFIVSLKIVVISNGVGFILRMRTKTLFFLKI